MVEHSAVNRNVVGSSPTSGANSRARGGTADTPDLGSGAARRGGSSPLEPTNFL